MSGPAVACEQSNGLLTGWFTGPRGTPEDAADPATQRPFRRRRLHVWLTARLVRMPFPAHWSPSLRLQPFFDDHRPTATGTPVRVFPAVAATPRLPEPGRWTNPILTLFVTMVVSVGLPWIPWLPVFTGLVVMALGVTLSVLCTISYLSWPDSREEASVEGAWVARQSGYRAGVHGGELRWIDQHGAIKTGHIARGSEGWDLVLTDQDADTGTAA